MDKVFNTFAGWHHVFKFLQRAQSEPIDLDTPSEAKPTGLVELLSPLVRGPGDRRRTANGTQPPPLAPIAGQIGEDEAAAALADLAFARPRSITYVAAPDTFGHRAAVSTILSEIAKQSSAGVAHMIVPNLTDHGLRLLTVAPKAARALVDGVTEAIEMLSVTIPAALASDSTEVARLALEEELRSGHDGAIDALKRRALAQNIGLMQTPQGYAIAPIHDGRVVQAEIFKALPEALKADVDAKLRGFESELSAALAERATLQQAVTQRLRDVDCDAAGLAVRAALKNVKAAVASDPEATAYLATLQADLIANAALFVPLASVTARPASPRAPIEIATDPRLARYRIYPVILPDAASPFAEPTALDRATLVGYVAAAPIGSVAALHGFAAGALTRTGAGIVAVDARALLENPQAWTLLRHVMRTGRAVPAIIGTHQGEHADVALPVACRIVVSGPLGLYKSLCATYADFEGAVRLVTAFDADVARTPDTERVFAAHAAAITADLGMSSLDGEALTALMGACTQTRSGKPRLSTDLDHVRDVLIAARHHGDPGAEHTTSADAIEAALPIAARGARAAASAVPA